MADRRKQITFDLNQALLQQSYPRKRIELSKDYYLKAYADIKRYMLKNGFDWIQQSVYESQRPMSISAVIEFVEAMNQKMPWLVGSANDIVASDVIAKRYNIKNLLSKAAARSRSDAELVFEDEEKVSNRPGLQEQINKAENEANKRLAVNPNRCKAKDTEQKKRCHREDSFGGHGAP